MTFIKLGDSSTPPATYPVADGWGFYIGGNTPHVWTSAEIATLKQRVRFLLPIFTRSHPNGAAGASADAAAMLTTAHGLGQPKATLIAVDLEAAIDAPYVTALDRLITAGGYRLVAYGQLSTVTRNPRPAGGYWVGEWDGVANDPSWTGKQYQDIGPYDVSMFAAAAPLWDTRPPAPPKPTPPAPAPATKEDQDMQQIEPLKDHPGEYAYGIPAGYSHIGFVADGYNQAPAKLRVVTWNSSAPIVHDGVEVGGSYSTKHNSVALTAVNGVAVNAVTIKREDSSDFPVGVYLW